MDSRIRSALILYAFSVLGLFLLVAPWTPIWSRAAVVLLPTPAGAWVRSGGVRGVASGLGAVDLMIALQVARELRRQMNPVLGPPEK